jgi:hypothetical protein
VDIHVVVLPTSSSPPPPGPTAPLYDIHSTPNSLYARAFFLGGRKQADAGPRKKERKKEEDSSENSILGCPRAKNFRNVSFPRPRKSKTYPFNREKLGWPRPCLPKKTTTLPVVVAILAILAIYCKYTVPRLSQKQNLHSLDMDYMVAWMCIYVYFHQRQNPLLACFHQE